MQCFTVDLQGYLYTPVDQHLEQQILGSAIWLHAIDLTEQLVLLHLVRAIVDVGHVRTIDLQHAEADIAVPAFVVCAFEDFSPCAAYALLCKIRNSRKACAISGRTVFTRICNLNQQPTKISASFAG